MRRILALAIAAAAVLPLPAHADPTVLMPGVTYERRVELTRRGPVALDVLTAPRPGGLHALRPVLARGSLLGRAPLTAIQRSLSASATAAGVNGDFSYARGEPLGVVLAGGVLQHAPFTRRSSIAFDTGGGLRVERATMLAYWQGAGQRRTFTGVNAAPGRSQPLGIRGAGLTTVYTPAWGAVTPAAPGAVEAVIPELPPLVPGVEVAGAVAELRQGGGTPIPPAGAVLASREGEAAALAAEAPAGSTVRLRFTLDPDWAGVSDAIGGGPVLVRAGRAVFRANELFEPAELAAREPRSAVAQRRDGRILLVTARGADAPGTGLTSFELAQALVRLDAVTAAGLGTGAATGMAFDGALLGRPAVAAPEPAIGSALMVLYEGVHAPPPGERVVSPNGDGIADRQTLAYKLVRPSTVEATLEGPGRTVRALPGGAREPGIHRLTWTGEGEPEGRWRLVVRAVDDRGRESTATQAFDVDTTLGFLRAAAGVKSLTASFRVARRARVAVVAETASGVRLRTLLARTVSPGTIRVRWDGRTASGAEAPAGTYALRVSAGRAQLEQRFSLRTR